MNQIQVEWTDLAVSSLGIRSVLDAMPSDVDGIQQLQHVAHHKELRRLADALTNDGPYEPSKTIDVGADTEAALEHAVAVLIRSVPRTSEVWPNVQKSVEALNRIGSLSRKALLPFA